MVKTWNRHRDRPVKPSFLLEIMALELFDGVSAATIAMRLKASSASSARLDKSAPAANLTTPQKYAAEHKLRTLVGTQTVELYRFSRALATVWP